MEYESPESVPAEWQVGDIILNRYEVRQKFEGGGMGMVYRVYHREWDMELAVKAPRANFFQTTEQKENFEREAETWVNLGLHPHIVSCYYVRRLGGIPRLFAEFVEGGTLDDWIRDGRLYEGEPNARTLRVLDIAIQIAWALSYAHEMGLVHQDVKPANIMMLPDGTAKLTDFGLARARSKLETAKSSPLNPAGRTIWVEGAGMLTPEYASPEQFRGETVSSRSDGWSWALTVLEMMQGGRGWSDGRFGPDALTDHYQQAVATDPIAQVLKEHLNPDLVQRPAILTNAAIKFIALFNKTSEQQFCRRIPEQLSLSASVLNNQGLSLLDIGREEDALVAFDTALTSNPSHLEALYNRGLLLWRNGKITDDEFANSVESIVCDQANSALQLHLLSHLHLERGDLRKAKELLSRSLEVKNSTDTKNALQCIHKMFPEDLSESSFGFALGRYAVNALTLSQDATKFLTVSDGIRRGNTITSSPVKLHLWESATDTCLLTLEGHTKNVYTVAASKNCKFAVTGSDDNTVRVWILKKDAHGCAHIMEGHEAAVNSVAISSAGPYAVSGSADKTVRLWDLRSGKCIHVFIGHSNAVGAVLLTADGKHCISAAHDCIKYWNIETKECTSTIQIKASCLALSLDDQWLLVGSDAGDSAFSRANCLNLIEFSTGQIIRTMRLPIGGVSSVAFSGDGEWALSGGSHLRLWHLPEGRCVQTLDMTATEVFFVEKNQWFICSRKNSSPNCHTWRSSAGVLSPFMVCRPSNVFEHSKKAQFFNQNLRLAENLFNTCQWREGVRFLRLAKKCEGYSENHKILRMIAAANRFGIRRKVIGGFCRKVFKGHVSAVSSLAILPDGKRAVSASADKSIRLWDIDSGNCIRVFNGHSRRINAVLPSHDGGRLFSSSRDNTIRVWNTMTGRCIGVQQGWTQNPNIWNDITHIAISPDGEDMITQERHLCKRSGSTAKIEKYYNSEVQRCRKPTFSAGGEWFAAIGNGMIAIIDSFSGECLKQIGEKVFADIFVSKKINVTLTYIQCIAISLDEKKILLGCIDGTIQLWDVATSECISVMIGHESSVRCVNFTRDGLWAVTGSRDCTLQIWNLATGSSACTLKGHIGSVNSLAIADDCSWVISGSDDQTLRLWEIDWDSEFRDSESAEHERQM